MTESHPVEDPAHVESKPKGHPDEQAGLYRHIDHVALAVKDILQASELFQKVFQLDLTMRLSYPPDGVHTNLVLSLGPESELELMGPIGERGFLCDFLRKQGEGVHHLALEVTDIDRATADLESRGVRVFARTAFKGMRFTILHPASTLSVGMQLMQRSSRKPSRNPLVQGIDRVAVRVSDPPAGRDFFLGRLKARAVGEGRDEQLHCAWERFVVGATRFDLLYDFSGPSPKAASDGLHHVALRVVDLEQAVRHFGALRIEPLAPWSGEESVFLPSDRMCGCLWRIVQG
ncbi:MAG: VOC family protein [Deltaproteobacteria bacterium]|nr:VOC family protein [Deltaproteobacteria bacterium]